MLKLYKKRRNGKDSANWYIRGSLRGIRVEKSTGTSDKKAAEAILVQMQAETLDRSIYGEVNTLSFAEAVNDYLNAGGEDRFLSPIVTYFGTALTADIDQRAIDKAARALYPRAKPATLIRQVYTPISAVLRYSGINIIVKRPTVQKTQPRFAEHEEIDQLIAHCNERLAALIVTMHYTGRRTSEMINLTWDQVDLTKRTFHIPKTKNGDPIDVPMSDRVFLALANLPGRKGKVFGYAVKDSLYGPLRTAQDKAGLEHKTLHEIGRHSFATLLLREGIPPHVVAKAGGWKSVKVLMDTYAHVTRDEVNEAVQNLGRLIDGKVKDVKAQ